MTLEEQLGVIGWDWVQIQECRMDGTIDKLSALCIACEITKNPDFEKLMNRTVYNISPELDEDNPIGRRVYIAIHLVKGA